MSSYYLNATNTQGGEKGRAVRMVAFGCNKLIKSRSRLHRDQAAGIEDNV